MRTQAPALATLLFAASAAGMAHAAPYVAEGCQLNAPADWTASKTRIARADKKMWASLLQASTAAEAITLEKGLGATLVSDGPGLTVLVTSVSYGGLTNKQFHAISKTTPSCVADVTAPAGAEEGAALAIAKTVSKH